MLYSIVFISAVFLAYSNGANDNFKGVSTLFGSGTADFKKALNWASLTTVLGSVASVFFASVLVKNFSGKGLVPDAYLTQPQFAIAIALGAAITVMVATKIGMPISTTHGLVGALTGVGLIAAGDQFNFSKLGSSFFLPLIMSPFIAMVISLSLYFIFNRLRRMSGITKESCVCVTEKVPLVAMANSNTSFEAHENSNVQLQTGTLKSCSDEYTGNIIGVSAQNILDTLHYISAGAVGFARGLNDTPKIVGLLLIISSLDMRISGIFISIAMVIGGLLNAKKVGETMSKKITKMNHGQGFTANLTTAALVTTASFSGLPVSTTHVSVGSIIGIGTVSKSINLITIKNIVLSWVLTLPIAALIGAIIYSILTKI